MPDVVTSFSHFVLTMSFVGKPMALQNICTIVAGQSDRVFMNIVATYMPKADVYRNCNNELTKISRSMSMNTCCIICG